MSNLIWVIIAIAVILVIVLAVLAARSRRSGLRPLPDGARARYSEAWKAVEARFVDEPTGAVSEADKLVLSVYHERGGRDDKLPNDVREARRTARDGRDESTTENLRRAMQHYRSAMKDMIGGDPREAPRRREVTS